MYIEQGYRGNLGLWKYLILPTGFIGLMVFNYLVTVNSPVSVEDTMAQMIEQFGTNLVLVILLAPKGIMGSLQEKLGFEILSPRRK